MAVAIAEKRLQPSSQQSLVQCQNLSVSNASSSGKLDELKAESFYDVKYWNVNYSVKFSSENCYFLLCCFFSAIWNISEMNIFRQNVNQNAKMIFLGDCFWTLETLVFVFYAFITEIYLTNIWRSVFDVIKGLRSSYPTLTWFYSKKLLRIFTLV